MASARVNLVVGAVAAVVVVIFVAVAYRMNLLPDVVLGTNRSVTTTFIPRGNRSTSPVLGSNVSVPTTLTPAGNRSTADGPKPPRDSTPKVPPRD